MIFGKYKTGFTRDPETKGKLFGKCWNVTVLNDLFTFTIFNIIVLILTVKIFIDQKSEAFSLIIQAH